MQLALLAALLVQISPDEVEIAVGGKICGIGDMPTCRDGDAPADFTPVELHAMRARGGKVGRLRVRRDRDGDYEVSGYGTVRAGGRALTAAARTDAGSVVLGFDDGTAMLIVDP